MGEPKYKQIEDDLLRKIQEDVYIEGSIIPTELALSKEYRVSRPTVRQAIQHLTNQGYLEKRKRRGTMVRQKKLAQEFTHIIQSYNEEMDAKGLKPITEVFHIGVERPSDEVRLNLGLQEDDSVYRLIRLRSVNGEPNVFVTSYIPANIVPDFLKVDFTTQSLYDLMAMNDVAVVRVRRKLEVIRADGTLAELLGVKQNDPVFYFHTTGFTVSGRPAEYSIAKYRGDLNYFVFELDR